MSRPRQSNGRVVRREPPPVKNPLIESTLDPDWNAQYKRANVRSVIARCYVAIAEMDYDLRMWRDEVRS